MGIVGIWWLPMIWWFHCPRWDDAPHLSMANLDLVHRLIQFIILYYISTNQQKKMQCT